MAVCTNAVRPRCGGWALVGCLGWLRCSCWPAGAPGNAALRRRGGLFSFLMRTCSKTRGRGAGSAGRFAGDLGDVLVDVGEATQPAAGQYRATAKVSSPSGGLAATGPRGCF